MFVLLDDGSKGVFDCFLPKSFGLGLSPVFPLKVV